MSNVFANAFTWATSQPAPPAGENLYVSFVMTTLNPTNNLVTYTAGNLDYRGVIFANFPWERSSSATFSGDGLSSFSSSGAGADGGPFGPTPSNAVSITITETSSSLGINFPGKSPISTGYTVDIQYPQASFSFTPSFDSTTGAAYGVFNNVFATLSLVPGGVAQSEPK
jgi:hypothetical protein